MIKTGDLKMVRGEGMPQYRNPFEKGRLIIQVCIKEDIWMLFLDCSEIFCSILTKIF